MSTARSLNNVHLVLVTIFNLSIKFPATFLCEWACRNTTEPSKNRVSKQNFVHTEVQWWFNHRRSGIIAQLSTPTRPNFWSESNGEATYVFLLSNIWLFDFKMRQKTFGGLSFHQVARSCCYLCFQGCYYGHKFVVSSHFRLELRRSTPVVAKSPVADQKVHLGCWRLDILKQLYDSCKKQR